VAKPGDKFFPISGWSTISFAEGQVGVEITWAESAADQLAGRLRVARLLVSSEHAIQLAESLQKQAAMAGQRQRPN
jgi:hypothetical protein